MPSNVTKSREPSYGLMHLKSIANGVIPGTKPT